MRTKIEFFLIVVIVNLLWYFVFNSYWLNFWLRLVLAITILNFMVLNKVDYDFSFNLSDLVGGFISAGILYFIFVVGKEVSQLILIGSHEQIMSVYALKKESNLLMIGIGLLVVGSGEEIFWRGFFQQQLMKKLGDKSAYIITSIMYGLIHFWTTNFILVLAALTAGLFWGYLLMRKKSLSMVIISHVVWDILIFIIAPLNF